MRQIHSVLEKEMKACVRTARLFDDEMDEFDHTASRRDAFDPLRRRKCSKLPTVPLFIAPEREARRRGAFLLTTGQNRSRLDKFLN